ncbi:hypothetical protein RSAG8_11948, partial [Rhizoctonia solani AG-8 WAC10335]
MTNTISAINDRPIGVLCVNLTVKHTTLRFSFIPRRATSISPGTFPSNAFPWKSYPIYSLLFPNNTPAIAPMLHCCAHPGAPSHSIVHISGPTLTIAPTHSVLPTH